MNRDLISTFVVIMLVAVGANAQDLSNLSAGDRFSGAQKPASLVSLRIDPETSVIQVLRSGRSNVNSSFDFVSATCTNCGTGCPPIMRTVVVVLQANTTVVGGYGISNLRVTNYTPTNVTYSTQGVLTSGQQLTITFTGDVLSCASWFNLYFSVCDIAPAAWSDTCPTFYFGPTVPLNSTAAVDSGDDREADVATDASGNWVTVWHSDENLGGVIGTDFDILVARSSDNGATWSSATTLNTNAIGDLGSDFHPRVAYSNGTWVAAWHSFSPLGGTIGSDTDILISRSVDNGATWSAPAALNTNAGSDLGFDFEVELATDSAGQVVAVWFSNETLGGTIGTDWDNLTAWSGDNGATWSAPTPLNTNAAGDSGSDRYPTVASGGGGRWVAVWHSTENLGGAIGTDNDILVTRSFDNGATWSAPAALNTNATSDSGNDSYPVVTYDGVGNWVTAWHTNENLGGAIGTDIDILLARSSDDGESWSAPAALNSNAGSDAGHDFYPTVTTDGAGNWVAAWQSNETLGGTIGLDDDILMARSNNNGASWSTPVALNINAGVDSGDDIDPALATNSNGNWVAVWTSDETLGGTIGTDTDILTAAGN